MIAELIQTRYRPGALKEAQKMYGEGLPERTSLSPLAGHWRSEHGVLNQTLELWPYDSLAHYADVQERIGRLAGWPAKALLDLSLEREVTLLAASSFSPPLQPRVLGRVYELRTYAWAIGAMPLVDERWAAKVPERVELSPLVGCFSTLTGRLDRLLHIWAYSDEAERLRIREEAVRIGAWPPAMEGRGGLSRQESLLMIPSPFSPLR
ncbi:MAG: NIPSNAP family protein [Solirubrobacteraceae bacterium]